MGFRLYLAPFVLVVVGALVPSWVQDPVHLGDRGPASVEEEVDLTNDPAIEISASHFTFQRRLTCEYIQYLQQELKDVNEPELSKSIDAAVEEIEREIKQTKDLNRRTKKLLKHTTRDLKKLGKAIHRKERLNRALNMVCHAERFMVGNAVRATAWIGTALTTLSLLPIRFVFSFGKGLFTSREPSEHSTTFNKTFGRTGRGIASIPLYELTRRVVFSGANPFLLPLFTAPLIDRHAGLICESPNERNAREVNFCKNYRAIKSSMSQAVRASQHAGVVLNESLLGERAVCSWKAKRQVRWVRDLLQKRRKEIMIAHPEIQDLQVGIPQYGECASIKVRAGKEALSTLSDSLGAFYEGVSLHYVASEVKPTSIDPRESVESFCQWTNEEKMRYAATPPEHNPDMKMLKLSFNPSRFARLDPHSLDTPKELLRSLPKNGNSLGRNVILYFGPTDEQREVWKTHEAKFQKESQRLSELRKKYKRIVRQKTLEDCVSEVRGDDSKTEDDFDYIDFLNLRESVPRDSVARAFLSESGYKTSFESAGKRLFGLVSTLKLKWELVEARTLNDLEKMLRDSNVENLVLLGHGFVNGMIADSSSALYHNGGFSWLTHRLHSLSFYSCYSKDIKTYGLDKKFAQTPTIHPRRHYFTMQGDQFGSDQGQSVLGAFPAFLEELDDFLARKAKGNLVARGLNLELAPLVEPRLVCQMKISGVKSERGSYTVRMGFNDVGTFDESNDGATFSFLCDWMKETPVIQFINQRVSDTEQNVIKIDHPQVIIRKSDGSEVVWSQYKTFPLKGDVIRGLRILP